MSVVKDLYLKTDALFQLASQPLPKDHDERDRFIAKVDEMLAERDELIANVNSKQLTEVEKRLGQELLKLNANLQQRLAQIQAEIRANLTDIKQKRETSRKYENPFDGPTSDGVFFDKRGV
ncbi:flagellar protein [Halalkalibacter wakoensis JCM 9140]|uniref:Flagellar protein FliT n=1 Tax=Halalkalibacter wakoensis JCM 9140 TaxID=1236970 RepID=W4Q4B0_9BACI|nr:flagellar protein FliT [Halalkalibacter wakoensis]GAE26538.1 flagellar protein [Halalkalibacter wakoensis JCM 9140]